MTLFYTDPIFPRHAVPDGHPERPARMAAIRTALEAPQFAALPRRTADPAPYEAIARAHPSAHLDKLDALRPAEGLIALDPDTVMSPDTWTAARVASGCAMAAVDAVLDGEDDSAFIAARPPGHHAERTRAMGFCLINHIAIAARHAQAAHGVERVAIVDFDVHHGNGTQDIFEDDPTVLYASTHQSPLFPGTGAASERGVGNIFNVPLGAGTDGAAFRPIFESAIVAPLDRFAPDLLLLSAGFDAHKDDPLGGFALVEDDFVWITRQMMAIAQKHCGGKVVSLLEGGYDLPALGQSTAAHISTLMNG
ncbi:MAG: histone deacetylase family protein [Pseudomonadota bacterium]